MPLQSVSGKKVAAKIIVITAYPDSPLAALGDVTIAIPAGQEKSVATNS
ncbi:MAG: hypothetical protein M5U34_37910 [Chloroflexi bacterium]|nr:hypothetical protein [Chloroflexota bacterium]